MLKKITNFTISLIGILMVYVGVYGIVFNTSNNMAQKNTFMQKVMADLYFDYDENSNSKYGTDVNDLYDSKWSSNNYPNEEIYRKANVKYGASAAPIANTISSVTRNIIIHSH